MLAAKRKWADTGADEADLGKEPGMEFGIAQQKVKWEQGGKFVERGQPHTLLLYRPKPVVKGPWATPHQSERLNTHRPEMHW